MAVAPTPAPLSFNYTAAVYTDTNGVVYPYQLYVPTAAKLETEPGQLYPLVLSLHGNDRRGTDNVRQIQVRTVTIWHGNGDNEQVEPTFILAPQAPPGRRFSEPEYAEALLHLLTDVVTRYPVDSTRLYLNGYSMGAASALSLLRKYPDVWAAAAAISGGVHTWESTDYERAVLTPLWLFAAEDDPLVPFALMETMAIALWQAKENPGEPDDTTDPDLRFTVFVAERGLRHWTDYAATHEQGYLDFFYARYRDAHTG